MAQTHPAYAPAITPDNHGPRVVIVGGIMLSATVLMISIGMYNRYNCRTLHHVDSALLLVGLTIDVACYTLICVAVKQGFGRRIDMLNHATILLIRKLFLASILVFFLSHGVIKISYNFLVRHTARSQPFKYAMDAFSIFIGCWALSNVAVTAVSLHTATSPKRLFFWISGAFSIVIVLGQLLAFIWVVWSTQAALKKKVRWTVSITAFVPICIASIIARLVYTPTDYFTSDWTINRILQALLFQIELNLMTITVLAPNLPVFFQKASTGGLFFLPGEATQGSRRATDPPAIHATELQRMRWSHMHAGGVFDGKAENTITSTATRSAGTNSKQEKTSFDSDVILMRRSFEVDGGVETAGESEESSKM